MRSSRRLTSKTACRLLGRYGDAFDGAYQQTYDAHMAVVDVHHIEQVLRGRAPALHLYRRPDQRPHEVQFRVYQPEQPVPLSDALPILENLGFQAIEERSFLVKPRDSVPVWIHDFGLARRDGADLALDVIGEPLEGGHGACLVPPDGRRRVQSTRGQSGTHLAPSGTAAHLRQVSAAGTDSVQRSIHAEHAGRRTRNWPGTSWNCLRRSFDPARDRQSPPIDRDPAGDPTGPGDGDQSGRRPDHQLLRQRGGSDIAHEFLSTHACRDNRKRTSR